MSEPCCLNYIRPRSLIKVVKKYIPAQLLSEIDPAIIERIERGERIDDDGLSIVQKLLDNSNHQLRMYGSAAELAKSLDIFVDFPLQYDYFGFQFDEDLATNPLEWVTIDNRKMMSKNDVIFHCYKSISSIPEEMNEGRYHRYFLAMRWKVHLAKQKRFEAVSAVVFHSKSFGETLDSVQQEVTSDMLEAVNAFNITVNSVDEFIREADTHIPLSAFLSELNGSDRKDFVEFVGKILALGSGYRMVQMLVDLVASFTMYEGFVMKLPSCFSPQSENGKKWVRVYKLETRNIVLLPELEDDGFTDIGDCLYLETITYENAIKRVTSGDVEFVFMPLKTTEHSAIPIMVTPGNFFKLAIDVFCELFRELIFCYKIFQTKNVPSLEIFFDGLKEFFDPEKTNGIYFINLKQEDVIRNYVSTYFKPIQGQKLKYVRNAKVDGFTLDNLKNELKNLGVVETLPGILKYCDIVYEHFDNQKKGEVLRTCDLFGAVEMCQLNGALERFPSLVKFFYSQNSCTRALFVNCAKCEISKVPPKFQNTVWKDVKLSEVSLEDLKIANEGTNVVTKRMLGPDGLELYNNNTAFLVTMAKFIEFSCEDSMMFTTAKYALVDSWNRFCFEHFLIETKEIVQSLNVFVDTYPGNSWINSANFVNKNIFLNLEEYCKNMREKKFYLRTFSTSAVHEEKERRVSRKEVLKVVLAAYSSIKDKSENGATNFIATFKKYGISWLTEDEMITISLEELESFLKEMDFNKELITLVPDISYASTVLESLMSVTANRSFRVPAPDYEWMLTVPEAQFQIFQYVICEIDWNVEVCKSHSDCKQKLRDNLLREMMRNAELKDGRHFLENDILARIVNFRKHCNYLKRQKFPTPMINLFGADFDDAISMAYFLSECEKYRLARFNYQIKSFSKQQLADAVIPVWKARILFMLGWTDMFFDEAKADLKDQILKSLMWRVPLVNWDSEEDFLTIILGTSKEKLAFAKSVTAKNAVEYAPVLLHPYFTNVNWISQTHIIRCQKWTEHEPVRQLLRRGKAIEHPDVQKLLNTAKLAIEKNLKQSKAKNNKLEQKSLNILREVMKEQTTVIVKEDVSKKKQIEKAVTVTEKVDKKTVAIEKEARQNEIRQADKSINGDLQPQCSASDHNVLDAPLEENKAFESKLSEQKSLIEQLRREHDAQIKSMTETMETMKKSKEDGDSKCRQLEKKLKDMEKFAAEVRTKDALIEERNSRIRALEKELKVQKKASESVAKKDKLIAEQDTKLAQSIKERDNDQKLAKNEISKKDKIVKEKELKIRSLERALAEETMNASKSLMEAKAEAEKLIAKVSSMEDELYRAQVHYQQSGNNENKLREANIRLQIMNETKDNTIQSLLDRIAAQSSAAYAVAQTQSMCRKSELSPEMRNTLRQLQYTRDTLLSENPMRQATDTAQLLIKMADEEDVKNGARRELKRYHSEFRGYCDAVENCIEMIQKNVEITREQLPALPQFPTFSEKFMSEYETAVKKAAITSVPEGELADPECLICLQNMTTEQQTIKCCHCKRRYHSDCAAEWSKRKSVCPACNGSLLDSEEFPSLG